jgi:hypothetical protein
MVCSGIHCVLHPLWHHLHLPDCLYLPSSKRLLSRFRPHLEITARIGLPRRGSHHRGRCCNQHRARFYPCLVTYFPDLEVATPQDAEARSVWNFRTESHVRHCSQQRSSQLMCLVHVSAASCVRTTPRTFTIIVSTSMVDESTC